MYERGELPVPIKAVKRRLRYVLGRMGYEVLRIKPRHGLRLAESAVPYVERAEFGASNLQTKLDNLKAGLPFEYPDIVNLNHAVVLLLNGGNQRIVELGCGTGKFALAAAEEGRFVVASECDGMTYRWCLENLPKRDNLVFVNGPVPSDLCPFDVSVSIEVVEHVSDYVGFLNQLRSLAPHSLITTPNRKRSASEYHSGPPGYFKHVREWTAGEFYWVLRSFWDDVRLYALTSQTEPRCIKVDVDTALSPLIADCRSAIARVAS